MASAALGRSDPSWAEFPLIVFLEPSIAAAIVLFVFAVSLISRRVGSFAALLSATPMFMIAGAPPEGLVGALTFFAVMLGLTSLSVLLAVAVCGIATAVRR
jgi:hypothetical protein